MFYKVQGLTASRKAYTLAGTLRKRCSDGYQTLEFTILEMSFEHV